MDESPSAWPVIPERGQSKAEALAVILSEIGMTRDDLSFASDDLRARLDAEFGSAS